MVSIYKKKKTLRQQISYSTRTVFLQHDSEAELILFTLTKGFANSNPKLTSESCKKRRNSVFEIHKLFVFLQEPFHTAFP